MNTMLIKDSAEGVTNVVRFVLERASRVNAYVQSRASDFDVQLIYQHYDLVYGGQIEVSVEANCDHYYLMVG